MQTKQNLKNIVKKKGIMYNEFVFYVLQSNIKLQDRRVTNEYFIKTHY